VSRAACSTLSVFAVLCTAKQYWQGLCVDMRSPACYHALDGCFFFYYRLLQALPAPLAASSAALVMLELPASFAVLLPAPVMQAPVALLLVLQLARAATGSQVLLHLAAAALCLAVLDDSWLVPVLQRVARCFTRGQAADGDTDGARPGGLQRADSNVSLASIMSCKQGGMGVQEGCMSQVCCKCAVRTLSANCAS
jgi:hypothetical protein